MKVINWIKKIKHNSRLITIIWYVIRMPIFRAKNSHYMRSVEKRKKGYNDEKYENLMKLKQKYSGKRCFIVATGPSLKLEDLDMIGNEVSFSMNSICKWYSKTKWRPTFYGIQDCYVYQSLKNDIRKWYTDYSHVFVADRILEVDNSVSSEAILFPLNCYYHENEMEIDKYFSDFSDNAYAVVYDGYSITYSLIQLAIYMGFSEIYLLGADCSYKKGQINHMAESGFVDKNEEKNYDKMIVGYKKAKEYAETHNIKIVNCTRGGMLEIYERSTLESVLRS